MILTSILLLVAALMLLTLSMFLHTGNYRMRSSSWSELVSQLQRVPLKDVERLALDNLNPQPNQLQLEPQEMWDLVGGMEGMVRMRENAQVLIALAAHVQQWNYIEATVVAERMRRDAVQIRRAVMKAQMERLLYKKWVRMPFYIHDLASSYYLMTQRLLALYQTSHVGLLPRLKEQLLASSC